MPQNPGLTDAVTTISTRRQLSNDTLRAANQHRATAVVARVPLTGRKTSGDRSVTPTESPLSSTGPTMNQLNVLQKKKRKQLAPPRSSGSNCCEWGAERGWDPLIARCPCQPFQFFFLSLHSRNHHSFILCGLFHHQTSDKFY